MILGFILQVFWGIIADALNQLPTTGLPASINSGLAAFFQFVYQFNGFFPVDTAFQLLGFTAAFWGIIFLWDFLHWIIRMVRGN